MTSVDLETAPNDLDSVDSATMPVAHNVPPRTGIRGWMDTNLEVQGFAIAPADRAALWLGLRFATGACLVLTVAALVSASAWAFFALATIGLIAGFGKRHPFDHVWNIVSRLRGGPQLPPSPVRRRHAFKFAGLAMLIVGSLFAFGFQIAGLILGGMLVAACSLVTTTNYCIPSTVLAAIEGRNSKPRASAAAG